MFKLEDTLAYWIFDWEGFDDFTCARVSENNDVFNFSVSPHWYFASAYYNSPTIRLYYQQETAQIPLYTYRDVDEFNCSTLDFLSMLRGSHLKYLHKDIITTIDSELFALIKSTVNSKFCTDRQISAPHVLLSSDYREQVEAVVGNKHRSGNLNVYYDESNQLHFILIDKYSKACIEVIDWYAGAIIANKDNTKYGLCLRGQDPTIRPSMISFWLHQRSNCSWCNNSREGQKWNYITKTMETVEEGCSHCGKNQV